MRYFGIPTCPYCRKRVNLIRAWSLKKHGEFLCPRCKGISNIYLSPLVYVFAILAVAAGFLIYFFQKFILDTVSYMTAVYVLIPFAVFFLLSPFFVYLEKPVIKKVKRTPDGRFFDENGRELKMRMGKLVEVEPSAPQASQELYRQDDNFDAPQQYEYHTNQNLPPREPDPVFSDFEDDEDIGEVDLSSFTSDTLADDEDLYAQAASKIKAENPDREYTIGIEKTQVLEGAARKAAAAPRAAEAPRERPQQRRVQAAVPAYEEPIPVGRVALERTEPKKESKPNSGFEDLFEMYSPNRQGAASRPRTASQQTRPQAAPPARKREENRDRKEKGTRFRQL